jgi:hypothetical protein
VACVYIGTRCCPQHIENSSLPFATVLRCCCLPHPVADVSSVPGEQVSEAYVSSCPCMGLGAYQDFGKCHRDCSLDVILLYASLYRRSSLSTIVNPAIRMSILSLLFLIMFLLLLALDSRIICILPYKS